MFRNTGANAFAKNQMRLAYEDKRDLYCICMNRRSKSRRFHCVRSEVKFDTHQTIQTAKISVKVVRVFLGNVTSFWSTFVLGGGVMLHSMVYSSRFIIVVCLVPLGHIRMWRDRLPWDSRVTCSRVSWRALYRERRS